MEKRGPKGPPTFYERWRRKVGHVFMAAREDVPPENELKAMFDRGKNPRSVLGLVRRRYSHWREPETPEEIATFDEMIKRRSALIRKAPKENTHASDP